MRFLKTRMLLGLLIVGLGAGAMGAETTAPFPYVPAKAYHIMPETHTDESGYFSLNEGLDGSIYVGTAAYSRNAYLVEFDPISEKQRIVIDTHELCGLTATGYAAQAKIHTRNDVGRTGKIYVGSKQGYRRGKDDTGAYPGGYVMSYDPRRDKAENLGLPVPAQGIIDVVADEKRDLLYVVTCEEQHWLAYDLRKKEYQKLGLLLTPYATTLIDRRGIASVVTKDLRLAQYDPATGKTMLRDLTVDGVKWSERDKKRAPIPTWRLAADGQTAYMVMMREAELYSIDLLAAGDQVEIKQHGLMAEGPKPDTRCAIDIAPDGRVYTLVRTNNNTGFGKGFLHWLARFDPKKGAIERLGVVMVKNPDFFDFSPGADGKRPPWSHGYHRLPDKTLTPLHSHMGMVVTADNAIYITILYPYTLLRIDKYKLPPPPPTAAGRYLEWSLEALDRAEAVRPRAVKIAEKIAGRHIKGGLIGSPWLYQALHQELQGRSGHMINIGFNRSFKKDRTPEERANDVALVGWDREPRTDELKKLQALKDRGAYIVGFGPKAMPSLAPHRALCDEFFDTGYDGDGEVVRLANGAAVGRGNLLVNTLNAWVVSAEIISALTRRGLMPTMWKSYAYPDGREWGNRYFRKKQFHDEFKVPPIPPGELSKRYLDRMRYHFRRYQRTQLPKVERAAALIEAELAAGRKTVVATSGHMPWQYAGKFKDAQWAEGIDLHWHVKNQVKQYLAKAREGALVLRLDQVGLHRSLVEFFAAKKQRVIVATGDNPDPDFRVPDSMLLSLDLGHAFGDACVFIEGYPIPILPPSGLMQLVAYQSLNAQVLAGLAGAEVEAE